MNILSMKKYLIRLPFQFACTFFFFLLHFSDKNLLYNNERIGENRYSYVFPYLRVKGNHLSFKSDLSSALGVISLLADKVPNHSG